MTRRGLLSFLGTALAGSAVIDPERLLWVPGEKLISIPAPTIIQPISTSDLLQLMIERVRPKLEEMWKDQLIVRKLIEGKPNTRLAIGTDNFRIPIYKSWYWDR